MICILVFIIIDIFFISFIQELTYSNDSRPGSIEQSVQFNGTYDVSPSIIDQLSSDPQLFSSGTSFTIAFWFKPTGQNDG